MTYGIRNAPPILKEARELQRKVQLAVMRMPRAHKYDVGAELRHDARAVIRSALLAWRDRAHQLDRVRAVSIAMDDFKVTMQLAQDVRAFASFRQFEDLARTASSLGRQVGGWLKQLRDEVKMTPNEISAHLKKNGLSALAKQEVENLIGLTELPAGVQKMVVDGRVEAKYLAPVRRFVAMPAVMKAIEKCLAQAIDWGGEVRADEVSEAISRALHEVCIDLTATESFCSNPVLFDWKTIKDRDYVVQHDGGAWCTDKKKFAEHQAEAKAAGLGPGGKRVKASKSDDAKPAAGEHVPTAAEKRAKTEQRTNSLRGKAEEYLHAYLMRALVPKIDEVAPHLMMFAALKRPNCYSSDWGTRGAPACHYPDGRADPIEKLGSMKAAQDHKIGSLDVVLERKPTSKAWDGIVRSIALETLFELPFRETLVLAHHVLGDKIEKIWKLDPAFLDLFRNAELRNLAKKHKVPPAEKPFEAMKGAEMKAWLLASPVCITAPQILVDLYRKVEKADRNGFLD